jgi:Zn-dependent M28 family amino/carboxypeptidase
VYLGPETAQALLARAKKPGEPVRGETLAARFAEQRALKSDAATIEVENVCGFLPGSDPELAKQVILLSAHYDHVGMQNGVVHNGADDNGSGSSALLAVAEALSEHGPLARSVMIMWVSGEEKGLWGSRAWSDKPWLPEGCELIANINIDMVGRNAPDQLLVTPTKARSKDHNGLVKLAEELAPLEGFPQLGSADEYYTRSDHYMFAKLGIPVMFLFADVHEDYHRPGDDAEKLDYDKVRRVARLVLRVLDGLQEKRLALR